MKSEHRQHKSDYKVARGDLNKKFVTQSDKKGLIAGKFMCSLDNMYLKFSIR